MEAKCSMCGKKIEINPMDKNYDSVKQGKPIFIICETCSRKTTIEAIKQQENQ